MNDKTTSAITRKTIGEQQRLSFLPQFCGPQHYLDYESCLYNCMKNSCKTYDGGYWEFYELSNGGFYLGLDSDQDKLEISCKSNFYAGEMSPDAASVGVNLFTQSHLACRDKIGAKQFSHKFYLLRDYAYEHAEASQIFRFID